MFKTAIATAILGLGIAGAYFVMQGPVLNEKTTIEESGNLPKSSPFVESLNSSGLNVVDTNYTDVLTENILEKVKSEIAENNPSGINPGDNLVVSDPDQIATQIISESIAKFDPKTLKLVVNDKDLKILPGTSKEMAAKYFSELNTVLIEYHTKVFPIFSSGKITDAVLESLTSKYGVILSGLYKIEVPSNIAFLHKKIIEQIGTQLNIYKKIQDYQNDPMLAVLASEYVDSALRDFISLSKEIQNFVRTNYINS